MLYFSLVDLCRTKSGVVLPLETRATYAAWPRPNGLGAETQTNSSAPHNATPRPNGLGAQTQTNISAPHIATPRPNGLGAQTQTNNSAPHNAAPFQADVPGIFGLWNHNKMRYNYY